MMRHGIWTAITPALILAACGPGGEGSNDTLAAPTTTEADIRAALVAADATQAGYAPDPAFTDVVRAVAGEADIDMAVAFEPGAKYRLIGRCGTGCDEIGIIASGPPASGSGQAIYGSSDEGAGTEVSIDFTAQHEKGRLTLTMWKCTAPSCLAGMRLYKLKAT